MANKVGSGLMWKMAINNIFPGCIIIPPKLDIWEAGGFLPYEARTCVVLPSLFRSPTPVLQASTVAHRSKQEVKPA